MRLQALSEPRKLGDGAASRAAMLLSHPGIPGSRSTLALSISADLCYISRSHLEMQTMTS